MNKYERATMICISVFFVLLFTCAINHTIPKGIAYDFINTNTPALLAICLLVGAIILINFPPYALVQKLKKEKTNLIEKSKKWGDNTKLAIIIFTVLITSFSFILGVYFLLSYTNTPNTDIPDLVTVDTHYLDAIKIYTNQTHLPIDDTWHIDSITAYFASQKEYNLLLVNYSNGTHTTYRLLFNDDNELKIFG